MMFLYTRYLLKSRLAVRGWVSDSRVLDVDGRVPRVDWWRVFLHSGGKRGLSLLQKGVDSFIVITAR